MSLPINPIAMQIILHGILDHVFDVLTVNRIHVSDNHPPLALHAYRGPNNRNSGMTGFYSLRSEYQREAGRDYSELEFAVQQIISSGACAVGAAYPDNEAKRQMVLDWYQAEIGRRFC
jgi:hypothetical protein